MHKHIRVEEHKVLRSVQRSRWFRTVMAGAIIGLAGAHAAIAGEPGPTPVKPPADLTRPQSPGPLKGAMRLDPSKFGGRTASGTPLSVESIQAACGAIDNRHFAEALRAIQTRENLCATASYSVDEQRAAGCRDADTADQCQVKLYGYCMDRGGDRAAFRRTANQELTAARHVRDLVEARIRYMEDTAALHGGDDGVRPPRYELPRLETVPIR